MNVPTHLNMVVNTNVSIHWADTLVNVVSDTNYILMKNVVKVSVQKMRRNLFVTIVTKIYTLNLDACGGLIEAVNGTITSPSFPDLYPANKNCIWEVLAPPQWKITVNFTHFDIEGNNVSQIKIVEEKRDKNGPRNFLLK